MEKYKYFKFRKSNNTLTFYKYSYEIDLDTCETQAQFDDWYKHLAEKDWVSLDMLREFSEFWEDNIK